MMNNILLYLFEMKKSHKIDDCSIIISIFLAIALLLLWNIKFIVYHIYCDDVVVFYVVTMVGCGCTGIWRVRHTIFLWLGMLFHCDGIQLLWLDFNPAAVSLPLLDYVCLVGLSEKGHAYADVGDNIIHVYMQLLQTQPQQSYSDSYNEGIKDRNVWLGAN